MELVQLQSSPFLSFRRLHFKIKWNPFKLNFSLNLSLRLWILDLNSNRIRSDFTSTSKTQFRVQMGSRSISKSYFIWIQIERVQHSIKNFYLPLKFYFGLKGNSFEHVFSFNFFSIKMKLNTVICGCKQTTLVRREMTFQFLLLLSSHRDPIEWNGEPADDPGQRLWWPAVRDVRLPPTGCQNCLAPSNDGCLTCTAADNEHLNSWFIYCLINFHQFQYFFKKWKQYKTIWINGMSPVCVLQSPVTL